MLWHFLNTVGLEAMIRAIAPRWGGGGAGNKNHNHSSLFWLNQNSLSFEKRSRRTCAHLALRQKI